MPRACAAIRKAGISRDLIDCVPTAFHHQSSRFQSKIFNRFGWRLAGLGPEGATELAGAEVRDFGQLFDRQRRRQVFLGVGRASFPACSAIPRRAPGIGKQPELRIS